MPHPGMAKCFLLDILGTLLKCTFNTVNSHIKLIDGLLPIALKQNSDISVTRNESQLIHQLYLALSPSYSMDSFL